MKNKETEISTNLAKLEEEIKNKKKLPQENKKAIFKKCLLNTILLIIILIYLICLQIGEQNIETGTYIATLKTLSIILIIGTTIMLEISYRTNKNNIIIHSIEILTLTFYTLLLISGYSIYYGNFHKITTTGMIVSGIYYILKNILIITNAKKKYQKSQNDIKSIVKN